MNANPPKTMKKTKITFSLPAGVSGERLRLVQRVLSGQEKSILPYNAYLVPHDLAKRLVAAQSILEDLHFVKDAMKELMEMEAETDQITNRNKILAGSLWYTSVILYGKCFTDAQKSSSTKLEAKEAFGVDEHLTNNHNHLMAVRHNFIAHRGISEYDESVVLFLDPIDKEFSFERPHRQVFYKRVIAPSLNAVKTYLATVEHVISYVERIVKKRGDLMDKEMISKDSKYLQECQVYLFPWLRPYDYGVNV